MANFFAFLIISGSLPFVALKKFNFLSPSPKETIFLQYLITKVITDSSGTQLSSALVSLSPSTHNSTDIDDNKGENTGTLIDEKEQVRAGLQMFVRFYMEGTTLPFVKEEGLFRTKLEQMKTFLT